jgi:hypothetical protein
MGSLILDKATFTLPEQSIIFAFNASNNQAEGIFFSPQPYFHSHVAIIFFAQKRTLL